MYIMKIRAKNTGETEFLNVFSAIETDTEIGWGADEKQPDGIKKWVVIRCEEAPKC